MINPANNKLLSILESFSKVELNRLTKFVNSPYFNSNEDVKKLYELLITKFEKGLQFEKIELWNSISKGSEFDSLRLRKISSDLLKLVEQFLIQEEFEKKEIIKANYLLSAIGSKELKKLYSTSLTNAYRISERSRFRESEFYLSQYQREKNIYELKNSDIDRSSQSNLKDIIDNLDYFYLAEKMRYLCEILIREDVTSSEFEILFRDEIIDHIKKYGYKDNPLVSIYYYMYLTLNGNNDENYKQLKKLLAVNVDIFPKYEAREIYTSIINYCIKKINQGDSKFLNEYFELNETLLNKNIITVDGLSPWKFKNIITAGLKLGKFDWVEDFINSYQNNIPSRYRENAITFNTAQLYFYQKRYEELLPILLQVDYEDFTYSLNSKLFTVITYFELDEDEAIYSFIDSFKTYLRRQKAISDKRKENYINFLKYTKKLAKNKFNKNQVTLLKIKSEIIEQGNTVSKEWLLEKIDQLLYPNKQRSSTAIERPSSQNETS